MRPHLSGRASGGLRRMLGAARGGLCLRPRMGGGAPLGAREIYLKNDAVNHPTLSFKDRVVAVALGKAREFGFDTVGCSSTGNLANAVAAQAAAGGFKSFIFVPADLEPEKIVGTLVYGA